MKLLNPIVDWKEFPKGTPQFAISQSFGNKWIADRDMTVGGIFIKKGENVYKKIAGHEGHNGLDIAAPKGSWLQAPHDGWVVEAIDKPTGYGIRITFYFEDDGHGWDATYGHLLRTEFPPIPWNINNRAWPVKKGQLVGQVDSTGASSGNHLHLTLRPYPLQLNNGYAGAVDPLPFISNDMTKFFKVNDHGKLGIMILEGFTGTIIFEDKWAEYQQLLKITGIDDNTPTIDIP